MASGRQRSLAVPFGPAKDLWRPVAAQDYVWPSVQSHNETKFNRYTFVNLTLQSSLRLFYFSLLSASGRAGIDWLIIDIIDILPIDLYFLYIRYVQ